MCAESRGPDVRVLIDSLEAGGSERVCVELCNGWAKQGTKVELVLFTPEGPSLKLLSERVSLTSLRVSRFRYGVVPLARLVRARPRVPTLTFGYEMGTLMGLFRFLGLQKARTVYREGNTPLRYVPSTMRWLYRLIAQNDVVFAQAKSIAQELSHLGVPTRKIQVIANPCPVADSLLRQAVRPPAASPDAECFLLAAGRLEPQKGFDRLLRGFQRFAMQRTKARLVILGEGSQRRALLDLAASLGLERQVELPGYVEDMSVWYRRADLFVLSSRYEGQPNVVIEAILHGCRVLCANGGGGTGELLADCGLSDCLVPDDSFEATFSDRASLAMNMNAAGFESAREKLVAMTDVGRVLSAYGEALKRRMKPES